jgi:hypothetical protein
MSIVFLANALAYLYGFTENSVRHIVFPLLLFGMIWVKLLAPTG